MPNDISGLKRNTATVLLLLSLSVAVQAADGPAGMPQPETSLAELSFVFLDTETTGLTPGDDRIVEIGAVRLQTAGGRSVTNWLVNPGRDIPPQAQRIHGITEEMVKDAPSFEEIYPLLLEFIGDEIIFAHNASFDVRFLAAEIEQAGLKPPENPFLDSLTLFRDWFPEAPGHSLAALTEYLRMETGELHRAANDAEAAADIFLKGINAFGISQPFSLIIDHAGRILRLSPEPPPEDSEADGRKNNNEVSS